MKTQHTPLPWTFQGAFNSKLIFIGQDNGKSLQGGADTIAVLTMRKDESALNQGEQVANADFIVLACNSHYELLEALTDAVSAGEYAVKLIEANDKAGQSANPMEKADWIGTCAHVYAAMSFLNKARAAISKATGE